ncbi:MAG TPA: copper homeostasis protein CutC [Pyrinomonadaceae bacterium]|nr:copper homeostasis protein CutC [Pyrinomonadaceae bacterium]
MLLEVIAESVADALEAERGGAHRLELVRDLGVGGLTPSLEVVRNIVGSVSLPVRVMLRERIDYDGGDDSDRRRLCALAAQVSELPVDGLVLGFLSGGRVDLEFTARLLRCAPNLKATFHHAFEEVEPFEAIQKLKTLKQVDRILTSGGRGEWPLKIEKLVRYQRAAGPEIRILVGGGLDIERIKLLLQKTDLQEFHVGRSVREPATAEGNVLAETVRTLIDAMHVSSITREKAEDTV